MTRQLWPLLTAAAIGWPSAALADDPHVPLALAIEPAVAIPLSAPQSTIYDVGGGETVKLFVGLTPYLDVGPAVSFLLLPAAASGTESGMAWGFGGGVRLKRPYDAGAISPWVAVDGLYVRSGGLDRAGFDAALGVSVPLGERRAVRIGPFIRYMQTIQPVRDGYDNRDAKILLVGLSFEAGSGRRMHAHEPVVERIEAPPAPAAIVAAPCPEPVSNERYSKIVVHKDKLELKEKLYFAWDQATLEPASFPVLDEVVQALADNQGFRVQVEGHTDSSGADDHNQTLSERRATAVVDYLVVHGVARDRLSSKGFSSSVPLDTNDTVAGRENNRRVEFVVTFVILNPADGGK